MRLIAFGGDARTDGVLDAAEKAGWETLHITGEYGAEIPSADAVLLSVGAVVSGKRSGRSTR